MAAIAIGLLAGGTATSIGQLTERPLSGALAHPAIGYYTRPARDLVSALSRSVEEGSVRLEFDETTGYLRPVLAALDVPVDSQMLVMSKTGIQALHTSPANPRAIFFNDAVTVGYIRGAPLLELAVQDPEQGVLFYTIEQKPQARPLIERRPACLTCHQNYSTLHVPGVLARSVFMSPEGLALSQFGSYDADDRTPLRRRWGGWYVTGHAAIPHIGNAVVTDTEKREAIVSDQTLHRIEPAALFDGRGYLSSQSDIAALMVFQHQAHMMNLITRAGWEARMQGGPPRDTIRELVDYLLFVDEEPLTAAVSGRSGFAERFAALGPADGRGRSLRQLDLDRRLLKYPCSFLIYSAAFRALPDDVRRAIYERMWELLAGQDPAAKYARLAAADRRAVMEILRATLPDLPDALR